jgi:hypothetical protein
MSGSEPPPYYYIAFIDEAGDPGLERVRPIDEPGGSEWLVMGCALIEAENEANPPNWIRSILDKAGAKNRPALHFRDLHEWQKPRACQALADLPVNLFVLCSNKKNMKQHRNERAARSAPLFSKQYFYNFCIRIILERVTECVLRHSVAKYGSPKLLKVVFSRRDGHSFGHTFAYSELLKIQSRAGTTWLGKRTIRWEVMNYLLLSKEAPESNAGLQLADVVTSAFYQAVDFLPPTKFNPKNAQLLRPRMTRLEGVYENQGVTFAPWDYWKADLLPEQIDIFEFYGFHRFDFQPRD